MGNTAIRSKWLFLFFLTVLNILFIALYFVLAYHNRFSFEDYYYIETLSFKKTIYETVRFYYCNWHGRWASLTYFYCWFGFINPISDFTFLIFLYHIFTLGLLIFSVFSILRKGAGFLFLSKQPALLILNLAVLFCLILYFFSFHIIEVWWWLCASFFHLQGIIFFCLAFSIIINNKVNTAVGYIILLICGVYAGASSEILAVLLAILVPATGAYIIKTGKKKISELIRFPVGKKVLFFYVVLLLALLSDILAPGITHRQQVLNNLASAQKMDQGIFKFYDGGTIINVFTHPRYLLCIILLILVFFAVNYFFKNIIENDKVVLLRKKIIPISVIVSLLAVIVTAALNIFAFKNNIGPLRSWFTANFFCVTSLFLIALVTGLSANLDEKLKSACSYIASIFAVIIMCIYIARQYKITSVYSNSYDKRWELLKSTSLSTEDIDSLYPPVPSGMLIDTRVTREDFDQIGNF